MATMHELMQSMYNKLDTFLKTETVVGEPMQIGKLQLIPIITASFGMGGGGSDGGKSKDGETGAGGGLGCRITPNAILVVKDDEVELITLDSPGCLDKLFDQIPELLKMAKGFKEEKKEDTETSEEEVQEEE